jgi:DNA-binding PadR family transcriptional regulator
MRANFENKEVLIGRQKIKLFKGQFIMGGIKSEEILKIARKTIYYWLDFLDKEGMIAIKKTNKYTIITIKNWDEYQQVAIKCPSNDTTNAHQMPTDNNKEELRRIKKNIPSEQSSQEIPKIIKLFEEVNPSIGKMYGNTTQRSAVQRLLKTHGKEKLAGIIKYLPIINADKYAKGKSITPLQLEDNLGLIIAHYKQQKNNQPKVIKV